MRQKKLSVYIAFSILLSMTSCGNAEKPQEAHTQPSTSTHDHSHGDHAGHDHTVPTNHTPDQQPAAAQQAEPAGKIPLFKFYKVKSGVSFENQDITKGQKSVFILFDPGCHHCKDEAKALGENYEKLKNINIYFISMNDPALMSTFLETFAPKLVNKPNVQVLYDRNQDFIQKFHIPSQFPANYIYSKDGNLETYWAGSKKIADVLTAYLK